MSMSVMSMLHDSDRYACFLLWPEKCITSPECSLNQMMDTASEVMPLLLRHNKGFGWWLSHGHSCRGCGEASSQQPDAPRTLLRTFQPSTSRCHEEVQIMEVHEMRYARGLPHTNLTLAPPEPKNILAGPRWSHLQLTALFEPHQCQSINDSSPIQMFCRSGVRTLWHISPSSGRRPELWSVCLINIHAADISDSWCSWTENSQLRSSFTPRSDPVS